MPQKLNLKLVQKTPVLPLTLQAWLSRSPVLQQAELWVTVWRACS